MDGCPNGRSIAALYYEAPNRPAQLAILSVEGGPLRAAFELAPGFFTVFSVEIKGKPRLLSLSPALPNKGASEGSSTNGDCRTTEAPTGETLAAITGPTNNTMTFVGITPNRYPKRGQRLQLGNNRSTLPDTG